MPKLIKKDPYLRYKAIKVVYQTKLRAKVIVERRDGSRHRLLMVIAPTSYNGKPNKVAEAVTKIMKISHPNVASVYEGYEYKGYCYWLMENWSSGNRRGLGFKTMTEGEKAMTCLRFVSAVRYLHENDIHHGNLTWDDLNFSRPTGNLDFTITDLGLVRLVSEDRYTQIMCGDDQGYGGPPEAQKGIFAAKGDSFTIGAVAYRILTGDMRESRLEERDDAVEVLRNNASDEAVDFCLKCLEPDVEKRLSSEEALHHPWFETAVCVDPSVVRGNRIIECLHDVDGQSDFKRLASSVVANHCNFHDLFEYREVFEVFDTKAKGYITREEWMKRMMEQGFPEEEANKLYLVIDRDHSGVVEYNEFLSATMQFKRDVDHEKLLESFHNIDHDGNGDVTGMDLVNVFDITLDHAKDLLRGVHNCDEIEEPSVSKEHFLSLFRDDVNGLLGHRLSWTNQISKLVLGANRKTLQMKISPLALME